MGIWNRFRQHRVAIKAVRMEYGRLLPYPIAVQWAKEDAAWNRFVDVWAEAALKGVDTTFLNDCPDLHRLAVERERH